MTEFGEYDPRTQERFLRVLEGGGECRRPRCIWWALGLIAVTILVVLAIASGCVWLFVPPAAPQEQPPAIEAEEVLAWRY